MEVEVKLSGLVVSWKISTSMEHCPLFLGLVGLTLKVMVASSGDSDPNLLELMDDKVLGHTWRPTEDKLVF